jgi:hypothetical protein
MTLIREFRSGIDSPSVCDGCSKESSQVVIEDYPDVGEHTSLCQNCTAVALSEHPKLMASAVVTLILRGKPGRVQS